MGGAAVVTAVALLVVAALARPASGGTRRHDVDDSEYTALGGDPQYASVGKLGSACGVLIESGWVLTVAHMVDGSGGMTFTVGGNSYSAIEWFAHPNWTGSLSAGYDIGLVRLTEAVSGVTPATRYAGALEPGETGTYVGFGYTGTGLTGYVSGTGGTKRAGRNVIDSSGAFAGWTNRTLAADFDNPDDPADNILGSPVPLGLEYCVAPGDSGGGLFIDVDGQPQLAGIHSFIACFDGSPDADYGDLMGSTRVSSFNAWIDDQLTARHWNNAAGGAFSAPGNWVDGAGAGTRAVAVFNIAGTYTVALSADVINNRLRVRKGDVTLDLAGRTYALTGSTYDASVVVGKSHNDATSLTITNGAMAGTDGAIGAQSEASGCLTVTGGGASLHLTGSLGVGGTPDSSGGAGTLSVEAGATVTVDGTLRIWTGGTVNVDGGTVTAAELDQSGGTLTGGAWYVGPDSTLLISGGDNITLNQGAVVLDGIGSSFSKIDSLADNQGAFSILNGRDFSTAGGLANSGAVTVGSGSTLTVNGGYTQTAGAATVDGTLCVVGGTANIQGGVLTLNSDAGAGGTGPALHLDHAAVHFGVTQHLADLSIDAAAVATVDGGVLVTEGLAMAKSGDDYTGTLDLHTRHLVVDYTDGDVFASIYDMVRCGANVEDGLPRWDGGGIVSSDAAGENLLYSVGVVDNAEMAAWGHALTSFGGEAVDITSVLAGYTYVGDANVDGCIDGQDFALLDYAFAAGDPGLVGWLWGDFNYDGSIDSMDYALLDYAYSVAGGDAPLGPLVGGDEPFGGKALTPEPVPEPAALTLMGLGGLLLLAAGRRRRAR